MMGIYITKGQTGIQSSPAWLSTEFYCFEETTNKRSAAITKALERCYYWMLTWSGASLPSS